MKRIGLVTGASRGIGLALSRSLLDEGFEVIACPRSDASPELSALYDEHRGRLHLLRLDVGDDSSVQMAARRVTDTVDHLDIVLNNAGIYPEDSGGLQRLDTLAMLRAFDVNALGPLRVVRALLPLLRRGREKRLIQITSLMGSIADNGSGGSWAYRMSKAALNMAVKNLAVELGSEGFIALAIHPGWVRTRMGGPEAPLQTEASAKEVLRIALEAGPEDNGAFKGPGGETLPY